jgi:NAD dependent epimerase/dehydratase family enzyme
LQTDTSNFNSNQISLISRSKLTPPEGVSQVFTWDQIKNEGTYFPMHKIYQKGLPKCDAIINIPGAGIMDKRWSEERKKELLDSRITPTKILVAAIEKTKEPPQVLVSGSAIGFYPTNSTLVMDEYYGGPPGDNFSGNYPEKKS